MQGDAPVLITEFAFQECCCDQVEAWWCVEDTEDLGEGATDCETVTARTCSFVVGPFDECIYDPETPGYFGARTVSGPYETQAECQAACTEFP